MCFPHFDRKTRIGIAAAGIIFLIVAASLYITGSLQKGSSSIRTEGAHTPTVTAPSSTIGVTATATSTATATPAGITTATPIFHQILSQPSPVCDNPSGTNWVSPNSSAVSYSCTGSGLLMQQVSSTVYAEFDLAQVNGRSYSQYNFRALVKATFKNTGDCSTWAAMTFQSPSNSAGGYIFGVTPCGQWRLQQVITATTIPVVASGSVGGISQAVIAVVVQNGAFTGSINRQQVASFNVGAPGASTETGLLVERDNASPSSQVLFSNFELDT